MNTASTPLCKSSPTTHHHKRLPAMASIRSLSDDELHAKLLELGITTPVTPSTRPLLVKKLLQAKGTKRSSVASPKRVTRRSLQSISSDEDEDDEDQEDEEEEEEREEKDDYNEDDYYEEQEEEDHQVSTSNNTSGNRSNLFRYNSNIAAAGSNNSNSRTPLGLHHGRTSTPSSQAKKNAASGGWTKQQQQQQQQQLDVTGKLFPSVSPARWQTGGSSALDYDTASDTDDLTSPSAYNNSNYRHSNGRAARKQPSRYAHRRDASTLDDTHYDDVEYSAQRSRLGLGTDVGDDSDSRSPIIGRRTPWLGAVRSPSGSAAAVVDGRSPVIGRRFEQHRKPPSDSGWDSWFSGLFTTSKAKSTTSTWRPSVAKKPWALSSVSNPFKNLLPINTSLPFPGISAVLLVALVAFFAFLGIRYLSMTVAVEQLAGEPWEEVSASQVDSDGLQLPLCAPQAAVTRTCLSLQEVTLAQKVLPYGRRVVAEAARRAAEYQCSAHSVGYLTGAELGAWLGEWAGLEASERPLAVSGLAKLSDLNPSLGLASVYLRAETSSTEGRGDLLGIGARTPQLHLLCAVMNGATVVLYVLALLALGGGVFYAVLSVARRLQRRRQQYQQEVFALVSEVVGQVSSDGSAAIQHVRDRLFSPKDRVACTGLWRDVVAFVDQHESRITKTVQLIGGEESETWRWIGQKDASAAVQSPGRSPGRATGLADTSHTSSQSRLNTTVTSPVIATTKNASLYPKLPVAGSEDEDEDVSLRRWWQGAGVSRSRSAVQAPTRCLKIRNMRTGASSVADVQRALLAKSHGHSVLHLAIDQGSEEGIVYLMADSVKAAGAIHSLLHGCWFGGQLLSVKFLRDERYLQRFPAAANCTTPL